MNSKTARFEANYICVDCGFASWNLHCDGGVAGRNDEDRVAEMSRKINFFSEWDVARDCAANAFCIGGAHLQAMDRRGHVAYRGV